MNYYVLRSCDCVFHDMIVLSVQCKLRVFVKESLIVENVIATSKNTIVIHKTQSKSRVFS